MDDVLRLVFYGNIGVSYTTRLEGGGRQYGQDYLGVISKKLGKVEHVFEYCAGPGFIGFSLLSSGLCAKLTLADINSASVELCRKTVRDNHLEDKVRVFESDCLDSIPETEKWDLVVSNPPHFLTDSEDIRLSDIRTFDLNLRVHKKLYERVGNFLKPGGSVIIQENGNVSRLGFTRPEDFENMISEGGLKIIEVFRPPDTLYPQFYFVWSKLKTA